MGETFSYRWHVPLLDREDKLRLHKIPSQYKMNNLDNTDLGCQADGTKAVDFQHSRRGSYTNRHGQGSRPLADADSKKSSAVGPAECKRPMPDEMTLGTGRCDRVAELGFTFLLFFRSPSNQSTTS
jgi:hypothetical protein